MESIINKYPKECKPSFEKFEKNVKNIPQNIQAILFIPEGNKTIVWFTIWKNKPVCVHLTKNLEYLSTLFVSFDKDCCYNNGTVFYGTMTNDNIFCIQECLLYFGKKINNFLLNLTNISDFLHKYTNNNILFNLS